MVSLESVRGALPKFVRDKILNCGKNHCAHPK